ncbi:MAG: translation initiation factor IF-2 [Gemmatimonadaceae bacterium]|nr:translation initiation factor IF-2 [Gemmatimonadaceae bacterium]MCW5825060.1 translation initiation factor IF-2 [Gemmatimonadaceae bacterium]
MSKIRVSELAAEFGIGADEVLTMLRAMDIPARTPASPLADDHVARARARWEREKRNRTETEAAPAKKKAAPKKKAAAKSADAKPAAKKKVAAKKAAKAEPEPAPAPAEEPVKTTRRRRAADVQKAEEEAAAAAAAAEAAAAVAEAERAARAAKEAEVAAKAAKEAEELAAARARADEAERQRQAELAAQAPTAAPAAPDAPSASAPPAATPRSAASEPARPRPIAPAPPRPRPVSGMNLPPRPIASATPGGGLGGGRRDDRGRTAGPGGGTGFGPNAAPSSGPRRGKKGKRVDQEQVTANISRTMRQMGGGTSKRRGGRDDSAAREELAAMRAEIAEREKTTIRVNEFITVSELAESLKVPATQIVSFAFKHLGLMVTINQRMDFDQIELIASEFGFIAVREEDYAAAPEEVEVDATEDLRPRPPVVTIMGHVDHGKTSLLDYIRKATVVAGEAGGITQHIGAYHVSLPDGRQITFLDTPGHEAFTAMRARGAQVTDIVVLVVAADDAVMPQTIEAISHAKNAGVPMIVAINKIDLPTANAMKVRQDLLQHGVVLEDFGGTTLASEISAKKGTGVPALLEQILLQAEILDLKANPDRRATGSVVEAQLDQGKGAVATILVQNGTLKVGDDFICGLHSGRVRALLDERGKQVKEAGPAVPVQVLGLTGVPMAGDQFICVADAQEAREIAQRRERLDREAKSRRTAKGAVSLEDFMAQAGSGEKRQLKLLIKADQGGPAEALADALQQLSNEEVQVEVVARAVGAVTESDILLAKASGAIIIGFHVRPDTKARAAADREGVEIKLYRIIYEAVADVRAALEGLLRPESKEVVVGEAEVRETFKVPKIGVIAGCYVRSGVINRQGRVRVVRDGVEVYDGTIGSLRRFKDDAKEVKEGYECGIGIENFNDLKVGDVIETYRTEEVARTLQPASAG